MTVLSTRVAQGVMGAALDTWFQTVLRDPTLLLFHEGEVRLLEEQPQDFEWLESFACGIWATGVDTTDLKLGNRVKALGINTGFYWKDSEPVREQAEATIADLEQIWDAAVWTNETLTWKETLDGWPPVPDGGAAADNVGVAEEILEQQPTDYGRFIDDEGIACEEIVAEFITVYKVRFPTP